MRPTELKSLFNARPYPGPLPQGEGESFTVLLVNLRLDSREAITNYQECSHAVPSPRREGQGEGGRHAIKSEPPHVVSYK
jgi:hypothetical protein